MSDDEDWYSGGYCDNPQHTSMTTQLARLNGQLAALRSRLQQAEALLRRWRGTAPRITQLDDETFEFLESAPTENK